MILEAKNVLYSYKSKRDKIILKNVSAMEEAMFYAIVGSSGSENHISFPFSGLG